MAARADSGGLTFGQPPRSRENRELGASFASRNLSFGKRDFSIGGTGRIKGRSAGLPRRPIPGARVESAVEEALHRQRGGTQRHGVGAEPAQLD